MIPLTQLRLKYLLDYDPLTGIWTWRNPNPRSDRHVGERAGGITTGGYRRIVVDCRSYRSARLAYFYMTGEWPTYEMDHINHDRDDDRWINLRSVDSAQNLRNRRYDLFRGIRVKGRKFNVWSCGQYLGSFDRLEPAMAIRDFAIWYNGETILERNIS